MSPIRKYNTHTNKVVQYSLFFFFCKKGIISIIAVTVVSTDAIIVSSPIENNIIKKIIDQNTEPLSCVTANGITTNTKPASKRKQA